VSVGIGMIINLLKSLLIEHLMKYQVQYLKPKKKGYSKQVATFLTIDDAAFWEQVIKNQGAKDIQILVK
jgi:hypothetical protein